MTVAWLDNSKWQKHVFWRLDSCWLFGYICEYARIHNI